MLSGVFWSFSLLLSELYLIVSINSWLYFVQVQNKHDFLPHFYTSLWAFQNDLVWIRIVYFFSIICWGAIRVIGVQRPESRIGDLLGSNIDLFGGLRTRSNEVHYWGAIRGLSPNRFWSLKCCCRSPESFHRCYLVVYLIDWRYNAFLVFNLVLRINKYVILYEKKNLKIKVIHGH